MGLLQRVGSGWIRRGRLCNQLTSHFDYSSPQIMLLAVDLHKDFVNVESINVAAVLALQSTGINGSELDAPETDRFSGYSDASLSEEILYITVTEAESIVEPNGVTNNIWRKSVAFICIHPPILSTPPV